MRVVQTGRFRRIVKKLQTAEKSALDRAVKKIVNSPELGGLKKGDLAGVRVFKFKVKSQQYLLAYTHDGQLMLVTLLAVGTHENFYRGLSM